MSEQQQEIVGVALREFGHILVTRDQGEPVRIHIMRLLEEHKTIELDFDHVEAYTPSFVDEVLGKCLKAIGPERFRASITLKASSPEVRRLANLVLSNRAAGCE